MNRNRVVWVLAACLAGSVVFQATPLFAQQGPPGHLSLGVSAGAGFVQTSRREDSWKFGPFFGGRFEWSGSTSAASLSVDVQPFRADRSNQAGDFRAVYLLPGVAMGAESRRIGLGLGLGVFDFRSEVGEDGTKVGFVAGASGAFRLQGSNFLELAWRRIRNVNGLSANVYMVQMVRRFRL